MYGATNAFASMYASADTKDWTVGGVLDVVQRRCSATLSGAGWYRVLQTGNPNGANSAIIDIKITRNYYYSNNEAHCIRFIKVYQNALFVDETSKSNTLIIDKIRYTTDADHGYVDVHYTGSSANTLFVDFDVAANLYQKQLIVSESLQSVADAPIGETVVTEYSFGANGVYTNTDLTVNGTFDVVPRRCSATLSSEGWYRVLDVSPLTSAMAQGALGESIRFDISRRGSSADAETHTIVYRAVNGGNGRFTDESSKSGSLLIDKIRYTRTSNSAHIDIHYNSSGSNDVTVYFDVNVVPDVQNRFTANNLASVADAPSGETVLTTHTFAATSKTPVEYGTANGWVYVVYADKTIEATRTISQTSSYYTTFGGFYGYYISGIALPFTMANNNYYVGTTWSIGSGFSIPAGLLSVTTTQFNAYALATAHGTTESVSLDLLLKGKIA